MKEVYKVKELIPAIIINRPSKKIKSPYLADIIINGKEYLAHSPSLGCSGLIITDSKILVTPKEGKDIKSKYSVDVVISNNILVGVNPNYASTLVYNAINMNLIKELPKFDELRREVTKNKSRFDLVGIKNNKTYFIEVKNVPLIDKNGIAIFPEGFRKKKSDTVSPRAIKHLEELIKIKEKEPDSECYTIFIIQRTGCKFFKPAETDPLYQKTLLKAKEKGVIIKAYQVNWIDNKVIWDKELKVIL